MFILALVFFQLPMSTSIELDDPGQDLASFDSEAIQLAADGSLLLAHETSLFHWNAQGSLINAIHLEVPKKFWLTCFYYDAITRRYWLVEPRNGKSVFYDENGAFLGDAYKLDSNGKKIPATYRQLFPTKDRLFASEGTTDTWKYPHAKVISEIQIERDAEGDFFIRNVGKPFCALTDAQKKLDYNFKLHWLVEDEYHNNLYVADQVTSRIRHFAPDPNLEDNMYELQKKTIPYSLPGYKKPPESWNHTIRSREEYNAWFYSWSRVNGFYRLRDGYLVGYNIPGKNGVGSRVVQKVAQNGKNLGKAVVIDGCLAGVFGNRVHIIDKSEKNPGQLTLHMFEM